MFHEYLQHKLGKSLERVARADVESYVADLTLRRDKEEITQGSIKGIAKTIRTFAEWLVDKGMLDSSEYYKIERYIKKIPGGDIGEDNVEALSNEEEKQVFRKLQDVLLQMLVWTGINFGLRRIEYCNLRVSHLELDREEPRLKIERSKGRRKKTRYIDLFPGQVSQWRKWLRFLASLSLPHDFVFFNPKNPSEEPNKDRVSSWFSKISRITGIDIPSHRLRYTYASRLWEGGVDIYIISYLLGHSKVETTVRYLKISERNFRKRFMESAKKLFH
jgi:site-specific recombinase XerD